MTLNIQMNLKHQPVLIVGGGQVALRKLTKLIQEEARITIVSDTFNESMIEFVQAYEEDCTVTLDKKLFSEGDVKNKILVIAATESEKINQQIYDICHKSKILCQTVTHKSQSDFSFMATKKVNGLTFSASSDDGLPALSRHYLDKLTEKIEDDLEAVYPLYKAIRDLVLELEPSQEKRKNILNEAASMNAEALKLLYRSLNTIKNDQLKTSMKGNQIGETMKITIGTRGSRLAVTQTTWVKNELMKANPGLEIDLEIIKTKGDKIQDIPLDKIGDKGLFVKEIENALLSKTIDLAVHSMKDMPSELPEGLCLTECPMREDERDVLITHHNIASIDQLPEGSLIGTGSKRRKYQLKSWRKDIKTKDIRGNVETRIQRIFDENLDGVILANAGIKRLGLESNENYNIIPIDHEVMLPAPCQGILALEIRCDDETTNEMIKKIVDRKTQIQCDAERAFLIGVEGGCHAPTGAYAQIDNDQVILTGLFGNMEGDQLVKKSLTGLINDGKLLGEKLAKEIKHELEKEG